MATLKEKLASQHGDSVKAAFGVGDAEPAPPSPHGNAPSGKLDGVKALREARLIALDRIEPDPEQPRKQFDHEKILDLAKSLEKYGQLQPIRVTWREDRGKYMIISGERRWRAARFTTRITELQCVVVDRLNEGQARQEQLIENCLREDLAPLEKAEAFQIVMTMNGWSARRLADELHMSHPTVLRALALLELPEAVQEQVRTGELSPTKAAEIASLDGPENQVALAEQIVAEKLTREQAVEAVKAKKAGTAATTTRVKEEFRRDDGTRITVTGPAAAGPDAVVAALKWALKQAHERRNEGAAQDQAA